jgi:LDH2 family malate/lactate/ureidoglycolate dehydrogenase
VVPRGKLEVYHKNGKPLPEQWALDAEGKPTTSAGEALRNIIHKLGGGIAPLGGVGESFGGHKGYGLGIIVDLFTALFSGGLSSNHVNTQPGHNGICHCFIAVDYGVFGDKGEIKGRVSRFLEELRNSGKAEGQGRIYTHGEKEAETLASRKNGAIPVNETSYGEMREIAQTQGVSWPWA